MTELDAAQVDRAIGAVIGSAAGDALGATYEFMPPAPSSAVIEMRSNGTWDVGEWTDDTAMAVPILEELAAGSDLRDDATLGRIVRRWMAWSADSKDVGIQIGTILRRLRSEITDAMSDAEVAVLCRKTAEELHNQTGRSAGNGSLMRTGPVAIGYLGDVDGLIAAARAVSDLTHFESDAGDACVIWSLAIRHAILTGEVDVASQVDLLPEASRTPWRERLAQANEGEPASFENNGWVVAALQAALSAIVRGSSLPDVLERAVRSGYDTDTVAAIAGSLAGAAYGANQCAHWEPVLHGWPNNSARDLHRLTTAAVAK